MPDPTHPEVAPEEVIAGEAASVTPVLDGNPKLLRLGRAINALGRLSPKLAGWIALQLFMRPRRIPISTAAAEFLDAADPLPLKTDTHRLTGYRWVDADTGHGLVGAPRVLLIHGWESHSGRWKPLANRLVSGGAEVVAVDGPAAGRSAGKRTPFNEYVRAVLDFEREHGPFDVYVGHSLGGGVAAQVAARLTPARRPRAMAIMATFDHSESVFARYRDMLGYSDRTWIGYLRQVKSLLGEGEGVRSYSNVAAVAQLSGVRGLVIHSEDDRVSPVAEGRAIHEAWPGAELWYYTDKGHRLTASELLDRLSDWVLRAGKLPRMAVPEKK